MTNNNYNTPFDDVFRTLLIKCSKLIIPVINEVFGADYSMDEEVTLLSNEHYVIDDDGETQKRVTDSCIKIRHNLYHIECQSRPDSTMEIRMIEYDFHIALSQSESDTKQQILRFPESAVMYLRHTRNTPDTLQIQLILPDKSKALYQIPIIKVQQYTKEEIFDKKLLFFIPYYILKFEKEIQIINSEQQQLTQLTADYEDIYTRLCQLEENKFIDSQYLHDLIGLTSRLIDVVAHNATNIRKEVSIVGGKVLELESERILKRGREEGRIENIQHTIKILRDLNTPDEIIKEKLMETFELPEKEVIDFMKR